MKIILITFVFVCITIKISVAQTTKSPEHTPPTAQFSVVNLCFGDSAHFQNQSTGAVSNLWIISYINTILQDTIVLDSVTTVDLSYYFSTQGTYLINLQENNGHLSQITKTIIVGNILNASFDFENCSNNFVNMSTCATGYYWDFGDGTTSINTLNNHQYADTGHYQVTCIVTNGTLYDTLIKQIYVSEIGYPKLTFNVTLSNDTLYGYITSPIGPNGTVTWYFGDSYTDNQINTMHIYADSVADYIVVARVFNTCGNILRDTSISITAITTLVETLGSGNSQFIIYPNPASDILTINQAKTEGIAIYNMQGQIEFEIKKSDNASVTKIDISKLNQGLHSIQIKTKDYIFVKKFIKTN
jgi:PKD repeat protein